MREEFNTNWSMLPKLFPNTVEAFDTLSWQYSGDYSEAILEFLQAWLVDEWQVLSLADFNGLSTVEKLAFHEFQILGVCQSCGAANSNRDIDGVFKCAECLSSGMLKA